MKKLFAILLFALLSPAFSFAQSDYKVVFDLTTKDTIDHKNVLRWINEISKADPKAKLEVVFYGKSLDLVVKDRSIQPALLTTLAANKNISFKVCEVAMKANNVEKSQLLAGVQTVPDGIYEIISKQKEGWGYIKVSH
jgi:uncharacterized protein